MDKIEELTWKETHDFKQAVYAANQYLDTPYLDPDGDECTISRQFLRMIERYEALTEAYEQGRKQAKAEALQEIQEGRELA